MNKPIHNLIDIPDTHDTRRVPAGIGGYQLYPEVEVRMNENVIQSPARLKTKKKPNCAKRLSVLDQARYESHLAGSTQDLSAYPLLRELARLAQHAKPRARSIECHGTRFPLSYSLWARVVLCPRSGRRLVGTVDL